MNLFQSGGHSSHPRPMPFGYVIVQYINQKSHYWDFFVHLLIWPQEGPKDEYFGPKWQTRLYSQNTYAMLAFGIFASLFYETRKGFVDSMKQGERSSTSLTLYPRSKEMEWVGYEPRPQSIFVRGHSIHSGLPALFLSRFASKELFKVELCPPSVTFKRVPLQPLFRRGSKKSF